MKYPALLIPAIAIVLVIIACGSQESTSVTVTAGCAELAPDNPYSPGSGHYAGFEWAQRNDVSSCGGNSTSFIEGCDEYLRQQAAYEECASKE